MRSVIAELADDLNFHRAAVALDVMARKANRGTQTAADCLGATLAFMGFSRDSLLQAAARRRRRSRPRIAERLAALNAKDFAKADAIRAALLAEGIQLMDGKDDAGERTTKWEMKR